MSHAGVCFASRIFFVDRTLDAALRAVNDTGAGTPQPAREPTYAHHRRSSSQCAPPKVRSAQGACPGGSVTAIGPVRSRAAPGAACQGRAERLTLGKNERRRHAGSARRAVRHLSGRPVPSFGRIRDRQAAARRRLRGRGAGGADLLRPAGMEFRRQGDREGDRPAGDRGVRGLRLRGGAFGVLRGDDRQGLSADAGRRSGLGRTGASAGGADVRDHQLPRRRAQGGARGAGGAGGGHLSRQLLEPARPRGRGAAAQAARAASTGWSCASCRSARSAAASAARSA